MEDINYVSPTAKATIDGTTYSGKPMTGAQADEAFAIKGDYPKQTAVIVGYTYGIDPEAVKDLPIEARRLMQLQALEINGLGENRAPAAEPVTPSTSDSSLPTS